MNVEFAGKIVHGITDAALFLKNGVAWDSLVAGVFTIGADTYELVDSGSGTVVATAGNIAIDIHATAAEVKANIADAINGSAPKKHLTITNPDGTAAAGIGTENVRCDIVGLVYSNSYDGFALQSALGPGGKPISGSTFDIAVNVVTGTDFQAHIRNTSPAADAHLPYAPATLVQTACFEVSDQQISDMAAGAIGAAIVALPFKIRGLNATKIAQTKAESAANTGNVVYADNVITIPTGSAGANNLLRVMAWG